MWRIAPQFSANRIMLPDEIYNLAAQSHVAAFLKYQYTSNVDGIGTFKDFRNNKITFKRKIKFYQAGTSEMFGGVQNIQDENTKFDPKSPYAASKAFAHSITKIYRDAYGIFAAKWNFI